MTLYPWRVSIIVLVSAKAAAEEAARGINSTGPEYDGDAFNVALSPAGTDPASHYGLCTSATDEMIAAMFSALAQIPSAMFWRTDTSDRLVASNVTQAEGQPWGWNESLAAADLQPVDIPMG
jgi:hypothetical protein